MLRIISYCILVTSVHCHNVLGQFHQSDILLSQKDSLSIKSSTLIFFQYGSNYYNNEFYPSVNAGIFVEVKNRFYMGPFYEHLLSPFKDKYPAVWVNDISYPNRYGSVVERTGPTDGNLEFGQNVYGLGGLFLTSERTKNEGCFYLGGGVGLYTGFLNQKPIFDIPEKECTFKNSVGLHILSGFLIQFTNKFGLSLSAKYHIVRRELDNRKSDHVSIEYDSHGVVARESRGEVCTYYINEYDEYGRLIRKTEIHDVDNLSGAYNNLSIQIGIVFNFLIISTF